FEMAALKLDHRAIPLALPVSITQADPGQKFATEPEVDHSTLNRWVVKYAPELDRQFRSRKRPVGSSWRLDETYVKIRGSWKYLYRAVDKAGATVDFLTWGDLGQGAMFNRA